MYDARRQIVCGYCKTVRNRWWSDQLLSEWLEDPWSICHGADMQVSVLFV